MRLCEASAYQRSASYMGWSLTYNRRKSDLKRQADAPGYLPPAHGPVGLPNISPAMRRDVNPLKSLGGSTLTNARLGFA